MALRRRTFAAGSPPPSFAAIVISLASLLKSAPRFASRAPLVRLIFDHLLCPDMGRNSDYSAAAANLCMPRISRSGAPRTRTLSRRATEDLWNRKGRELSIGGAATLPRLRAVPRAFPGRRAEQTLAQTERFRCRLD